MHYVISVTKKKTPSYTICGTALWQRDVGLHLISGFQSALDLEVFELTPKETVLGIFSDESSLQKIVPFSFLVARNYIHCCKWTDTKPVLNIFKIKVKQKERIEKINALVENKMYKR